MKTLHNPYKKKVPEISSVKITKEAFKKMNLYASIVSEIIGSDKECMGALLNYENKNDNIVRDVYLWKNQTITSGSGSTSAYPDADKEAKENNMGVIGLWHSHGNISVFHSAADENFLTQMYKEINNKIITSEKEKNIEYIVKDENIRLFEKGSNKEIRIKGKIDDIKYIERDECNILNSIVINNNSYSGGYANPELKHDYDAEVWAGYNKKECERFKNIELELIDEVNNIQLDKEKLVKEVGAKVKFQDSYLKDLPNYQKILNGYKEENDESIEQFVEEEEDKKKVSLESIIPSTSQTKVSGRGYYKQIHDFYSVRKSDEDEIISKISLIGEILAGDYHEEDKRYWLWEDRLKKAKEVYKKMKGNICEEQNITLGNLLDILNVNYYAKKKYGKKLNKMCKKMGFKNKIQVKKSKGFFSKIFRRKKK